MRRDTWEIVSRKSVADHNVLPGTWYLKCKMKPDCTINIFNAQYCVRGDVQKRLSSEPLNLYSTVVQWTIVRLMLNFQCILGFQSQSINFTNTFAKADISVELPRDFKSDGGQCDVVIRLKKSLYVQAKSPRLWY